MIPLGRLARNAAFLLGGLALAACAAPGAADRAPAHTLRVLTLNIQVDGRDGRVPRLVELIRQTGADVAAMQEVDAAGPEIARQLGFKYARLNSDKAIVSRYPLEPGPGADAVKVRVPGIHGDVVLMDLHLYYTPYQPYQLLGIPYDSGRFIKTEAEAVDEARKARGKDVDAAVADLRALGSEPLGVIVVGDFNEPSHLDWTERAAAAKRHPIAVAWPSTKAFADFGLRDAYRELNPDEMAKPGFTWTPGLDPADPKDHADRIDFVLYRGQGLRARSASIVGEDAAHADVVVAPYPSDHRGVLVTFGLEDARTAHAAR